MWCSEKLVVAYFFWATLYVQRISYYHNIISQHAISGDFSRTAVQSPRRAMRRRKDSVFSIMRRRCKHIQLLKPKPKFHYCDFVKIVVSCQRSSFINPTWHDTLDKLFWVRRKYCSTCFRLAVVCTPSRHEVEEMGLILWNFINYCPYLSFYFKQLCKQLFVFCIF